MKIKEETKNQKRNDVDFHASLLLSLLAKDFTRIESTGEYDWSLIGGRYYASPNTSENECSCTYCCM